MHKILLFIFITACVTGCTFPPLVFKIGLDDFDQSYSFNFSKEELKKKIIKLDPYYDIVGDTLPPELRQTVADTTHILVSKLHKAVQVRVIISGNENTSQLRVTNLEAFRSKEFKKPLIAYQEKVKRWLNKIIISELN